MAKQDFLDNLYKLIFPDDTEELSKKEKEKIVKSHIKDMMKDEHSLEKNKEERDAEDRDIKYLRGVLGLPNIEYNSSTGEYNFTPFTPEKEKFENLGKNFYGLPPRVDPLINPKKALSDPPTDDTEVEPAYPQQKRKKKKSGGKVYASHNKRYAYGGKVSGRKATYKY